MSTADVFNMNGLTTFALGEGLKAEKDEFGRVTITTSKKGDVYSKAEVDQKIEDIELTPGPKGEKGDTGPQGPKGDPGEDATVSIDTTMPEAPTDDHVPSTQLLKELLAGYLKLTGGTLTGPITAPSYNIQKGNATHDGGIISIPNGPQMAGAVGIVYKRPQQSNFKPVFMGVSGGDTDSRIQIGDGSTPNADSGLTVVFGIHTPDDRTWARSDLWFTDKVGDVQGTRTWWGLVQDGNELRIVKDKGTPKAYLPTSGGIINGDLKFSKEQDELWVSTIKSFAGTPIYDVTYNRGSNFLSIYQLTGFTASGQRGKVFFTQENATTNWIDVTTLKEGGTPIADKYAAKRDVYTKAEVDEKISSALGDIQTALAAI